MRRSTILSFGPFVLSWLLLVAWALSGFWSYWIICPLKNRPDGGGHARLVCRAGTLAVVYGGSPSNLKLKYRPRNDFDEFWGWADTSLALFDDGSIKHISATIPILVVLTLLLPLSAAPFLHCRYPIWAWLVWVAVIASESAFYLG